MKTILLLVSLLGTLLSANMTVAVTYPYIGALTRTIGGEHVDVNVLAKGNWDPHFVVARPSLIATLRNADGLIINGAQLEIGWLPPLIKRANNRNVLPGGGRFLDLSQSVSLIQKPANASRAGGDVHPDGNPHFHLDPNNILLLAKAISGYLGNIDPQHGDAYHANYAAFRTAWEADLARWKTRMHDAEGKQVIEYHRNFDYFLNAYGVESIATIEPLPGIPPSSRHTLELIELIQMKHPCCIVHDVYHPTKTAEYLREKTGIRIVILPHDIGALDSIDSLRSLFDYLTDALHG